MKLAALVCALSLAAPPAMAQVADCDRLVELKEQTYGFRPSQLSREEQARKSEALDQFWDAAKSLGPAGIACLAQMLREEHQDPFFSFNAAMLLFNLDKSADTVAVVTDAVQRSGLDEVDPAGYIGLLLRLNAHGADIGPLAATYLRHPKVDTYLPGHGGMKLDRVSGATLLYGSMPRDAAEKHLLEALSFSEPHAREAAFFMLAMMMTEASFRAIRGHALISALPEPMRQTLQPVLFYQPVEVPQAPPLDGDIVRARLKLIVDPPDEIDWDNPPDVAGDDDFMASAIVHLGPADILLLQESRRRSIRGVSDESLYEYFALSRLLLAIINRHDLYSEYRHGPESPNP